jgi:hypothetical protein
MCDITEQHIKTDGHRKDLALRQIDCEDKLEMKKERKEKEESVFQVTLITQRA